MGDPLRQLFERLEREGDLQQLVQEKTQENLHLEFKEKEDRSHGNLDDDDRKNFSKVLSSFANADGGILIFGIATARSPDAPDHAHELKPIVDAARFRAKLMDSILNATHPVIDGVVINTVDGTAGGYVKCLIPASDRPPHRAMLASREYYRRTSTGDRRMEHDELADIFGRRLRPVLSVIAHLSSSPQSGEAHLFFSVVNSGRGIARHFGFVCTVDAGQTKITSRSNLPGCSFVPGTGDSIEFDAAARVIHPHGVPVHLGSLGIRRERPGVPVQVKLLWYAENTGSRELTLPVSDDRPGLFEVP